MIDREATPVVPQRPLLPPGVAEELKRAAALSSGMARMLAIEDVMRRARISHPEYFREDD